MILDRPSLDQPSVIKRYARFWTKYAQLLGPKLALNSTTFTDAQVAWRSPQYFGTNLEHHIMLLVNLIFFKRKSFQNLIFWIASFWIAVGWLWLWFLMVSWESTLGFWPCEPRPCEPQPCGLSQAQAHAAGHFGPTGCAQHPKARNKSWAARYKCWIMIING